MRRRNFLRVLGGGVAARGARAAGRARAADWLADRRGRKRSGEASRAALQEALAKLGWIEGRNLRIDLRFGADDPDRIRAYAAELVGLAPDVIVTGPGGDEGGATADADHSDRLHGGRRPRGHWPGAKHCTTRGQYHRVQRSEPSIAGKWLELLKEAAPRVTRVAIIFNPELAPTAPIYIS